MAILIRSRYTVEMTTRSIARAGMSAALYGVILLLNTMLGTGVENIFPYLFAAPILYIALTSTTAISLCAFVAMLALTFMLAGMTTWLIAGSMLLGGLILGLGFKRKTPFWAVAATFVVQSAAAWLTMTVFAALFGYDASEERELMKLLGNLISWDGLVLLVACFSGLLETIALSCLAVLMTLKIPGMYKKLYTGLKFSLDPPLSWAFLVSLILWYLSHTRVLSFPVVLQDICLFLVLGIGVVLIAAGARVCFQKLIERDGKPILASVIMIGCFIPGIQLIPLGIGFYTLFKKSLQSKGKKDHETIS